MSYFLSDEYTGERFNITIDGIKDPKLLAELNESKEKFQERFGNEFNKQRRLFVREFATRFHALASYKEFSRAQGFTDQKLSQAVEGLAENDFVELAATSGGSVEDASDILTIKTAELMRNYKGKKTSSAKKYNYRQ